MRDLRHDAVAAQGLEAVVLLGGLTWQRRRSRGTAAIALVHVSAAARPYQWNFHVAAAASPRPVSTESKSQPRHRHNPPPRNIHVTAAASPRPVSTEYPRRSRGVAATCLSGIYPCRSAATRLIEYPRRSHGVAATRRHDISKLFLATRKETSLRDAPLRRRPMAPPVETNRHTSLDARTNQGAADGGRSSTPASSATHRSAAASAPSTWPWNASVSVPAKWTRSCGSRNLSSP